MPKKKASAILEVGGDDSRDVQHLHRDGTVSIFAEEWAEEEEASDEHLGLHGHKFQPIRLCALIGQFFRSLLACFKFPLSKAERHSAARFLVQSRVSIQNLNIDRPSCENYSSGFLWRLHWEYIGIAWELYRL